MSEQNFIRASITKDGLVAFTATMDFVAEKQVEGTPAVRPKFNINAYNGGAMNVGFGLPVVVDLSGLTAARQEMPILLGHDMSNIVGQTDKITIDATGVNMSGKFTGDDDDPSVRKVVSHAKNGFKWQASIGASIVRREFVESGKAVTVNGQKFNGPILIAREATLVETSIVAIGADNSTATRVAASHKTPLSKGNIMTFEKWLEAKGFDITKLDATQSASLKAAFDAENLAASIKGDEGEGKGKKKVEASPDLDEALRAAEAEHDRRRGIAEITANTVREKPELAAQLRTMSQSAIEAGWTVQKYELEVMRAGRVSTSFAITKSNGTSEPLVIEASLAMSAGLKDAEKHYAPQVLEAANKQFRRGIGLTETLRLFASQNGYTGTERNLESLLRAAMSPDIQASGAPSTVSLPEILSNVANKFLAQGFNAVEDSWRQIAAIRPVKDFKATKGVSLSGGFQFEKVGKDGQLKHGVPTETAYANQADTYGLMLGITRQDIINDDAGALSGTPMKIGRGGALALNDVFWRAFLDNSSFFSTGNANYLASATESLMDITGLTKAEELFLNQTDPDSKPLGITPRILLVPNALNAKASAIMKSTEYRDTTASTKYATANPHAGKFSVVRSSYLHNTSYTGYSALAWYLLADPGDLAVIEVAFLNGQQTPTVESAQADFNTLGIQMRGFWDFGVTKQEYRAGVKMKGEA